MSDAPLSGLRVVEFTHMIMGPSVGAILASLGAEVIHVEPIGGDKTRNLVGSGAGFFATFNRGKQSICIDLKSADGIAVAKKLIDSADVLVENYRPGAMDRLGLDFESLAASNPRLIYCSAKGFLKGPYEERTALDEVAQMMGGLAYMTGPPGRPLRAGASVIDITGGMFGVIAIQAALEERHRTGRGQRVQSALFETTVYLIAQHMAQMAVTGNAAAPMPARLSVWAIYDVFETKDDPIFIGVVTDSLWKKFCNLFGLDALWADESLRENNARVMRRDDIIPLIRKMVGRFTRAEILTKLEGSGLPFAPIARPEDMFEDPHLNASGGLESVILPDGRETKLPLLPIEMDGRRLGTPPEIPAAGAHSDILLAELGYAEGEIAQLKKAGAVE
jgi:crotonobetainyl-CoA:carnitine CoA-transferase CaiB-like acyl-CoA transferase